MRKALQAGYRRPEFMAGHTNKFIFALFCLNAFSHIVDDGDHIDDLPTCIKDRASLDQGPAFGMSSLIQRIADDSFYVLLSSKHTPMGQLRMWKDLTLLINERIFVNNLP